MNFIYFYGVQTFQLQVSRFYSLFLIEFVHLFVSSLCTLMNPMNGYFLIVCIIVNAPVDPVTVSLLSHAAVALYKSVVCSEHRIV